MENPANYLDLYDFRCRVFGMYWKRNHALNEGQEPVVVHDRFRVAWDHLFARHLQSALSPSDRNRFTG